VQRRWTRPGPVFRYVNLNFNAWQGFNYGGERTGAGGNVNANGQFRNYWGFYSGMNRQLGGYNASELRGGPMIRRPGGRGGWLGFYSDSRKRISGELGGESFTQDENPSHQWSVWQYVSWRPSSSMQFSLGPGYTFIHDNWLNAGRATVGTRTYYLLAETDQAWLRANFRANITFTPTLTLQAYVAPFYATVRYVGFKRLEEPRAVVYADRFRALDRDPAQTAVVLDVDRNGTYETNLGNPDFSSTSLNTNFVLRWEYRPGSTVFVVWQQGRSASGGDGEFRLRDVGRSIVDALPRNLFLVKVNYWLSL
jgi:hypothetical protein